MIVGHYASALIPHSRDRAAPLALFLWCAIMQDLLWLAFAAVGWEPTWPESILDASFSKVAVEMTFSHDLLAAVVWMLVAGALGLAVTRSWTTATWCAALCFGHELLDLLSGYTHHVAGPATRPIGLNLYATAPVTAIAIEAAFGSCMVLAYGASEAQQGRPLPRRKQATLYATFVLGALAMLPGAERSLRDWFG